MTIASTAHSVCFHHSSTGEFVEDQERQRLLAQYAEIASLAGGLAHEIRNPLSTITLNLELLIEDVEASETPRDRRMLGKLRKVQEIGRAHV